MEPANVTTTATAASAMAARGRSGVRLHAMPQMACATTATATSFSPCRKPSATGPVNEAAPMAKPNMITADGMVKANQAARPPNSPLPRRTPREKPAWLEDGPGRNWQSATRSAYVVSSSHLRRTTSSLR